MSGGLQIILALAVCGIILYWVFYGEEI